MNITSTLTTKQILIIFASLFVGACLLFAVLKWQGSWAEDIFFKATKQKLEQAVKDKEAIIDTLNGEVTSLNTINAKLEAKLSKNKKALDDLAKEREKAKDKNKNLSGKEVAKKLTEWGY